MTHREQISFYLCAVYRQAYAMEKHQSAFDEGRECSNSDAHWRGTRVMLAESQRLLHAAVDGIDPLTLIREVTVPDYIEAEFKLAQPKSKDCACAQAGGVRCEFCPIIMELTGGQHQAADRAMVTIFKGRMQDA